MFLFCSQIPYYLHCITPPPPPAGSILLPISDLQLALPLLLDLLHPVLLLSFPLNLCALLFIQPFLKLNTEHFTLLLPPAFALSPPSHTCLPRLVYPGLFTTAFKPTSRLHYFVVLYP